MAVHKHKSWDPKPINELHNTNYFDNALVVVSNSLARTETKWTIEELKMFYMVVSRVAGRDKDNWLTIPKSELASKIGYDYNHTDRVRAVIKSMAIKSYLQIDNYQGYEWFDGFCFTNFKGTKNDVSIQFNANFLPLVEQLSTHFTEFYLDCIINFNHKSSLKLYTYLTSWANLDYLDQNQKLPKGQLAQVFDLKEGQYWRNYGKPTQKFDWGKFEERVLIPAITEINNTKGCDMRIVEWSKVKENGVILGYEFVYAFRDKNGQWNVD